MSDRGMAGAEGALLVAAVGLGALAGLAWTGAQAAALAFGAHHPIDVNLGDAFAALPQLAASPGEPAYAWPKTATPALPGPWVTGPRPSRCWHSPPYWSSSPRRGW